MWIVVNIAKSRENAERIQALLASEGILVKKKPVYKKLDEQKNYYEISVLESEVDAAREVLLEAGY